MILTMAQNSMQPELRNILKVCFNEKDEAIDLLFKEKFNENNTVVCIEDGKIVSAAYIFDNYIVYNKKKLPSCYMYAVATLPEYQGKGFMRKLLKYAEDISKENGKFFSTLYPATTSLYDFYEKLGYKYFFKTSILEVDDYKLKNILDNSVDNKEKKTINFSYIFNLRENFYKQSGQAFWDESTIRYACKANNIYGGTTIISGRSYAICRREKDSVIVVDSAILPEDAKSIIKSIKDKYNAKKYQFRLPVGMQLFGVSGKDIPFGMIKPLVNNSVCDKILKEIKNPYLGLVMD